MSLRLREKHFLSSLASKRTVFLKVILHYSAIPSVFLHGGPLARAHTHRSTTVGHPRLCVGKLTRLCSPHALPSAPGPEWLLRGPYVLSDHSFIPNSNPPTLSSQFLSFLTAFTPFER